MPVNHSIFESINDAQWLWYHYNFEKDDHDKFIYTRDFLEYLASFIEPEAVQKIKNARENTYSDPNFDKNIEKIFGKKVDFDKITKK